MSCKILYPLLKSLRKKNFSPKLRRKIMSFYELSGKADIWRTLTDQVTLGASSTNNFPKQNRFTLEDQAQRFGQSVADNLLECDPKDWSRIKAIVILIIIIIIIIIIIMMIMIIIIITININNNNNIDIFKGI